MKTKPFILKSTSLLLSFWMLIASTGLSVDFHYCEGEIVDWSIFTDDLGCEHEKELESKIDCCEATHAMVCNDNEENHLTRGNCCSSDEAEVIIETEFNISSNEVEFEIPQLLFLWSFLEPANNTLIAEVNREYSISLPKQRHKNLSINQVFLL